MSLCIQCESIVKLEIPSLSESGPLLAPSKRVALMFHALELSVNSCSEGSAAGLVFYDNAQARPAKQARSWLEYHVRTMLLLLNLKYQGPESYIAGVVRSKDNNPFMTIHHHTSGQVAPRGSCKSQGQNKHSSRDRQIKQQNVMLQSLKTFLASQSTATSHLFPSCCTMTLCGSCLDLP